MKLKSDSIPLIKNNSEILTKITSVHQLKQWLKKSANVLSYVLKTTEFKRLLRESEEYRRWVEREWNNKQKDVLRLLISITGLRISAIKVRVLVTHPSLPNGSCIPDQRLILWGHPEDWNNYTVVYLCHELLHILTYNKYVRKDVMHAIIELATDNELRIRLNRSGVYFREGDASVGHSRLRNIEKRILPFWRKYIQGGFPAKDILDFEKRIAQRMP